MTTMRNLIAIFLLGLGSSLFAQLKLPTFFGSNMVLQNKEQVSIWGWDTPNVTITVKGSWGQEATTTVNEKGQWKVKLQTPAPGGPYTVSFRGSEYAVSTNVMIGEVWLCSGQSNMEMPMRGFENQPIENSSEVIANSKNDQIRLFNVGNNSGVKLNYNVKGQWVSADPTTVRDFSATAYFFGKELNEKLNVPIGIILTAWSGSNIEAWMDEESITAYKTIDVTKRDEKKDPNHTPTVVYNAMIHPLIGFTMKGAIWYQGESNRTTSNQYKKLFPAMIESWRSKWKLGDFPFYFVQIAPYSFKDANAAFLREAQLQTMQKTANTGMVVTSDIGDCSALHPPKKKDVGVRLANWALAKNYNFSSIAYCGPIYKKRDEAVDGKIKLYFDYSSKGLKSSEQKIVGFEVASDSKIFYPAEATINSDNTVTVWSSQVRNPTEVRYAFKSCSNGSLINAEGLPASPFRTDGWDDVK